MDSDNKQTSLADFGFISRCLLLRQTKLDEFPLESSDSESAAVDELEQLFGALFKENDSK